ncbi:MAG: hypothetical protein WCK26_03255 [Candidatus Saccharibacteria bacterium]
MTYNKYKNVKNWVFSIIFVASFGGSLMTVAIPQTTFAVVECNSGFLGFPAWYRGLTYMDNTGNACAIEGPDPKKEDSLSIFIWHIVLNVLEIAIVATAYVSAFYTLYGGFLFITSRGNPEGAAKARSTMLQAVIGLIISLIAVGAVNFIVDGILK